MTPITLRDLYKPYYRVSEPWFTDYNDEDTGGGRGITMTEGLVYYNLVRLLKPEIVVETGTNRGNSARFIALALKDNKLGHLHTIDSQEHSGELVKENPYVTLHTADALEWITQHKGIMAGCNLFCHDDDHTDAHVLKELDLVTQEYKTLVITLHDVEPYGEIHKKHNIHVPECAGLWAKLIDDLTLYPEYTRLRVPSVMGVGILQRKD